MLRMRIFGKTAMACACLLAGAGVANAQEANPTAERADVLPKNVVQVGHQAPIEAVAWLNGGSHLLSLASDGSIIVWDVSRQVILNRAQIPANWRNMGLGDCMKPEALRVDKQAQTVTISYLLEPSDGAGLMAQLDGCPNRGAEFNTRFSFVFDTRSGTITETTKRILTDKELERAYERFRFPEYVPLDEEGPDRENPIWNAYFPLSPNKAWRPAPDRTFWVSRDTVEEFLRPDLTEVFEEGGDDCPPGEACRFQASRPWGLILTRVKGGSEVALSGNSQSILADADFSPDGNSLAWLQGSETNPELNIIDLADGMRPEGSRQLDQPFNEVAWIDAGRHVLYAQPRTVEVGEDYVSYPAAMALLDDAGGLIAGGDRALCDGAERKDLCLEYVERLEGETESLEYEGSLRPRVKPANIPLETWGLAGHPDLQGQQVTAIMYTNDQRKLVVATLDRGEAGEAAADDGVEPHGGPIPAPVPTGDAGDIPPGSSLFRCAGSVDEAFNNPPESAMTLRVVAFDLAPDGRASSPRELLRFNPRLIPLAASEGYNCSNEYIEPDPIHALYASANDGYAYFFQSRSGYWSIKAPSDRLFDLHVLDISRDAPAATYQVNSDDVFFVDDDLVFIPKDQLSIELGTGRTKNFSFDRTPTKAGYIERANLIWLLSDTGEVHFLDRGTGAEVFTLYIFPGNRFFVVTPEGRYDTNLSPDSDLIRWVVSDAPWQSLAAQTFMRDFYEPGLYKKLLDCRENENCGRVFKSLPSIADLSRQLPEVELVGVEAGPRPDQALVTVSVTANSANRAGGPGAYNLRLFRNGRVVALTPQTRNEPSVAANDWRETVTQWRAQNALPMEGGRYRHTFTVPLPTAADGEPQRFSAYAFNEDRVKSETATALYNPAAIPQRPRRAFIINIGVDDYDAEVIRDLDYAANDAKLLARTLSDIPGYELRQVTVGSGPSADGVLVKVDGEAILDSLRLVLSDEGRTDRLSRLRAKGIEASALEQATPDDLVIISFSGHGWADAQGNFYLIPSDAKWELGDPTPDFASVISSAQLADILQNLQAGEITLILDACHSAASVESSGFKPGPMGDGGLGQLAYDKGILILAATQADDVALEKDELQQGLLSFALAEGLGRIEDPEADGISLSEWLDYAARRVPTLVRDVNQGNLREILWADNEDEVQPSRTQQPSLFDFNGAQSPVKLKAARNSSRVTE